MSTVQKVQPRWYIVHTYSGQEDRVKKNLELRIETMDVKDKIFQVVVPTEEEIEIKEGRRKPVAKRVFPRLHHRSDGDGRRELARSTEHARRDRVRLGRG